MDVGLIDLVDHGQWYNVIPLDGAPKALLDRMRALFSSALTFTYTI